jgi:broad specificity phosphatase PhoE
VEHRVSGDPSIDVPLTEEGEAQARRLGAELANLPLDACLHTQFSRTRRTAELALEDRGVELRAEPLLDDIKVGELEGLSVDEYRDWKARHDRSTPFPGGETLDDAARRYALAYRQLLAAGHVCVLVVCHEIPIRYALNAAAGSSSLDGPEHAIPNAVPYLFDEDALERATAGIERLTPQVPGANGI